MIHFILNLVNLTSWYLVHSLHFVTTPLHWLPLLLFLRFNRLHYSPATMLQYCLEFLFTVLLTWMFFCHECFVDINVLLTSMFCFASINMFELLNIALRKGVNFLEENLISFNDRINHWKRSNCETCTVVLIYF